MPSKPKPTTGANLKAKPSKNKGFKVHGHTPNPAQKTRNT